ncbi:hypothetical protein [Variovorax paradoxus]|uniref:hypothetical protein n=1 Tax=Variovorax paradoxus TaxID=34073 RepID=UPI003D6466F6
MANGPRRKLVTWLLLLSVPPSSATTISPKWYTSRDPSFKIFRSTLAKAVAKRDARVLRTLLSPELIFSYAGIEGPDEFLKIYDLSNKSSAIWGELSRVLALGGVFEQQGVYVAPYAYSEFPVDREPWKYVVVVARGATLVSAPREDGTIFARVPNEILERARKPGEDEEWIEVRYAGAGAWIRSAHVWDPTSPHLVARKLGGKWLITDYIFVEMPNQ